ncbi:MAG: lytic transglycosylase domain-containing protein [Bdellovibrionota bacterium]
MKFNKLYITAIVIGLFHVPSTSYQTILAMPSVDLASVFEHQKELVGSKRLPSAFQENKNAEQIVSQLVLEIVRESLPKNYKNQSEKVAKTIIEEANKYEMDPLFLTSIIKHESAFNPKSIGLVGEIGLMQIRPTTAKWLNDKYKIVKKVNLKNPITNIKLGAFFLNKLRGKFDNNSRYYMSAYNMGAAKLRQKLKENVKPKEYVGHVMKHYVKYMERLEVAAEKSLQLSEAEMMIRTAQLCNGIPAKHLAYN